jgi:hypothetical protein
MKYKFIDLDKKKPVFVGGGAFGEYYRLNSRVGVKILKFYGLSDGKKYSKEWAITQLQWAQKEAKNLQKAKNSKIVPTFKGYCIVKLDNQYRPAILMQHLENYINAQKFLDYDDPKSPDGSRYDWKTWPFKRHVKFAKKLKMETVINAGTLYEHVNKILKKRSKIEHQDLHCANIMFKLRGSHVVSIRVVDLESVTEVVDKGS